MSSRLNDSATVVRYLNAEATDVADGQDHSGVISLVSLISPSKPWPTPMSRSALIGVAGDFINLVEPHTEADPAAVLVSLLVGVGNAVGDGPHFRVEGDRHTARLFAVIAGDTSSGRKGTSFGRVRESLTFAFEDYAVRIVNGMSSGEGIIHHVRDPEPSTDEDECSEVVERRLLVVEGEFAQVLKAASRNGNTLSPVIRNLWDSGNVQVLTRNNPLKATGAHVSILGHITLEELAAELTASDTANGFANRFLWICARRSKLLPDGGNLDANDLLPVCEQLERIGTWARTPRQLKRDAESSEFWRSIYPALSSGHQGAFGKATSRAEAQVLRLSVLYAVLDRSPLIGLRHLQAALAVWEYAEESAQVIFGQSTGNRDSDRILRALKGRPDGLTQTDISELFDRHLSADKKKAAFAPISDQIEVVKVATGGRPREVIRLRSAKSETSEERSAA